MQFIVSKKEFIPPVIAPDIIETLGDDYEIWTYEDYERLPPLLVGVSDCRQSPRLFAEDFSVFNVYPMSSTFSFLFSKYLDTKFYGIPGFIQ